MKRLLILFWFLVCFHGNSQQKIETVFNEIKRDTMKILDLNIYKDWKVNTYYTQTSEDINLLKGNEKIRIISIGEITKIEHSNTINPYYIFQSIILKLSY